MSFSDLQAFLDNKDSFSEGDVLKLVLANIELHLKHFQIVLLCGCAVEDVASVARNSTVAKYVHIDS